MTNLVMEYLSIARFFKWLMLATSDKFATIHCSHYNNAG